MNSIKSLVRFGLVVAGSVIGGAVISSQAVLAAPLELVQNGEFEVGNNSSSWSIVNSIDGWSSTEGQFETWTQGAFGSPSMGTDGLATGRHLELNLHGGNTTISHSFQTSADLLGTASFSFDAWKRGSGTGSYKVLGSLSGILAAGDMNLNAGSWTQNLAKFAFNPGELITLNFTGRGDSANTPHIDQVSFMADIKEDVAATPEPTSMLALLAIAGAATQLKRKNAAEEEA